MTTPVVHLPDDLRQQIIDHCLSELPNEGCGLLAMDGDVVVKVYPTGNDLASPTNYTIPPQDHLDSLFDAEASGWRLGGVFHSHPSGPAELSAVDIAAALDPEWLYMVVSPADGPVVRGWSVRNLEISEILLV